VETCVVGEFRMERCHRTSCVANENRNSVVAGEHLDVGTDAFDEWGADEHRMEWVGEAGDGQISLEAVELAAVAIASHRHVDQIESALIGSTIEHVSGAQDHAGTGAESGQAIDETTLEIVEEPAGGEQPGHRGALAAGQDDRVESLEVGGSPYERRRGTESFEALSMDVECPLQGEHTDREAGPGTSGVTNPDRHIAG